MTLSSSIPVLSQQKAKEFADKWQHTEEEERYAKSFWTDFFKNLCGVEDEKIAGIEFEYPVQSVATGRKNRIDVFWKNTVLIEHKSKGEDLDKAEFQARGYLRSLPKGYQPKTLIICDFATFRIVDVRQNRTQEFLLKDLPKYINRFEFIISGNRPQFLEDEIEVDQKAAKLMANLYTELENNKYTGHETSVFLSRLLFLLFGDDTNMWEHNLVKKILFATDESGNDVGETLAELFDFLNTADAKRKRSEKFRGLPYVNGGIFAESIKVVKFNKRMRAALIDAANYDWSGINPTIFGALFQLIKSKEERGELGEHYTSEENINKIIYPLFLDELQDRLTSAWNSKKALKVLKQELTKIKILDPACGCGNFLVVAYKHLRQLEIELIVRLQELEGKESDIGLDGTFGLSITMNQFHGIEILEWPAQVARMALFLTDHQQNLKLAKITGIAPSRFPIKDSVNVINDNALEKAWEEVIDADEFTYILGNPPFLGHKERTKSQAKDHLNVWGEVSASGTLDYVTCWFLLAAKLVSKTQSKVAFVSTNSISQGRQPDVLWQGLNQYKVKIDFAYQSFRWSNESSGQAVVTCVIIGFSSLQVQTVKKLWVRDESDATLVDQINPYLVDGPLVTTPSRSMPVSESLTEANYGSMAIDDGHLIFDHEEAAEAIKKEPSIKQFMSRFIGGREMIRNEKRYCLWLVDVPPKLILESRVIQERLKLVSSFRKSSTRGATRKLAETPALFGENRQPKSSYVALAKVSSEKRAYLPADIFDSKVIASGSILTICSDSPLFDFAVVCSRPMSIWNQAVSGRMKTDFQISVEITYNNFPLPNITSQQKKELIKLADRVLAARKDFKDSTIEELYGEVSMPLALLDAHKALDTYMLSLYGLKSSSTDTQVLKVLFETYSALIR